MRATAFTTPIRRPATSWHFDQGADIVVMIHPDYQYTPKLLDLPAMVDLMARGLYACVLDSRFLGGQALEGGMPVWRDAAEPKV